MSESRDYFARVAEHWDALRSTFFGDEVRAAIVAQAGIGGNAVVVDVGTGTGFLVAAFAPLARKVYGVDTSPEMLALAAQNLALFANVDWRVADGLALPLDDNMADAVVANMYLHHVDDPAHAIREMARVARPGGRVVLADLDEHTHTWLQEEHHDRWLGFRRDEVHRWFVGAGLNDVVVGDVGATCCTASCRGEAAAIRIFIARGCKTQPQAGLG